MSLDLAGVKPGFINFFIVGAMALIFLTLGRYLTTRFPIPGLTDIFKYATGE